MAGDNPLFEELQAVHAMIRADLARVSLLADASAGGVASEEIRERLDELKSSTILWQLKYGCMRHCRFVHSHHSLEDRAIFPTMRAREPDLGDVIDRLEADHRSVSDSLRSVEASVADLDSGDASISARERLVAALNDLGELLLEHLDFEERSLERPLGRMRTWAG
jgi:iron-sulfur cluster repair protein YtfE (RIC family)